MTTRVDGAQTQRAAYRGPGRRQVITYGLMFWLLLAPGDNWTWFIVGGHESRDGCEQQRSERLDVEWVVCASTADEEPPTELAAQRTVDERR